MWLEQRQQALLELHVSDPNKVRLILETWR